MRATALVAILFMVVAPAPAQNDQRTAYIFFNFNHDGGVSISTDWNSQSVDSELLRSALFQSMRRQPADVTGDSSYFSADFDRFAVRRGLLREAEVDLRPLWAAFRQQGIEQITVLTRTPTAAVAEAAGSRQGGRGDATFRFTSSTGEAPRTLRVAYGFRDSDIARIAIWALLLLALPVLLAFWMRRAALAAGPDPAAAWFGYWQFVQWATVGLFLGWWAATDMLRIHDLLRFFMHPARDAPWAPLAGVLVVVGPPVLPVLLIAAISHTVQQRLTKSELTRRDTMVQTAWVLAMCLVPVVLLLGAVHWIIDGRYRGAVMAVLASGVVVILASRRIQAASDMTPHALTFGELRNRVFALAERAGVKLIHLYVLPLGKQRMANAFAARGDTLVLTNYLLDCLSKREVDAIVAHELTHLRRRDPARLATLLVVGAAAATVTVIVLEELFFQPARLPLLPVSILLALLCTWFFQRRMERAADAGSVQLTGDPESMITALVRLSHLSVLPVRWSRWSERTLTHPSTERRGEAIARRAGISPERLRELLTLRDADAERYAIPATAVPGGKVFSTDFKNRLTMRVTWTLIAAMTVTPAVFAAAVQFGALDGGWRWLAYAAGFAVTCLMLLLAIDRAPASGEDELRDKLREKLRAEGLDVEAWGGTFVGFAPEAYPRLYENNWSWDVGFLFAASDQLSYAGEEARFGIPRDQIRDIRLVRGAPGWLRTRALQVRWGDGGAFLFRPAASGSLTRLDKEAAQLHQRLSEWWRDDSPPRPLPAPLAALPPPAIGDVTSLAPTAVVTPSAVARNVVFLCAVALAVSLLLGLSFGPACYVIAVTAALAVLQTVPFLRYHDPA